MSGLRSLGLVGSSSRILTASNAINPSMDQWSSGRELRGYDPITGYYYFLTSSAFYRTLDPTSGFTSISLPGTAPFAGNRLRVIRAGAYIYCMTVTSTDGSTAPAIYRSDPTTISWTKVLDFGAKSDVIMTGIDFDDQYIYAIEYSSAAQGETANGGPTNGTHIYRTAITDGATWTTVKTVANIAGGGVRHGHTVACDPYNPGHVYAAYGDSGSDRKIDRSTDYGATWTTIVGSAQASFQAVQISFSPNWVWFAGDGWSLGGLTVWVMNRTDLTPKWASLDYHRNVPVPGGRGAIDLTDLSFTGASSTATSATAGFTTAAHKGRFIYGNAQLADGTYIASVTNSTTIVMSRTSANTIASQSATLGGDEWYAGGYYGVVDPATERYYFVSNDTSIGGTQTGIFVLDQVGGQIRLWKRLHTTADDMMFLLNNYIWVHKYRLPLPGKSITTVPQVA